MIVICFLFFFFSKQKTAYEMRISDWSSDVCSSDLRQAARAVVLRGDLPAQRDDVFPHDPKADAEMGLGNGVAVDRGGHLRAVGIVPVEDALQPPRLEIGRASCRERVCQYV